MIHLLKFTAYLPLPSASVTMSQLGGDHPPPEAQVRAMSRASVCQVRGAGTTEAGSSFTLPAHVFTLFHMSELMTLLRWSRGLH